ncbi:YaaA family protein [bacterium]|nr:YaaA family protein [bacterium]
MLVLLNSTKTMDPDAPVPARLSPTEPAFAAEAADLAARLARLGPRDLARQMGLGPRLVDETRAMLARWGAADEPRAPALFAFTGLVYKHVAPGEWTAAARRDAQARLVILSGLYGLLRPCDLVAAYRLEMGSRFRPPRAASLTAWWRPRLTAALNERLGEGEPVLDLAAQEYTKALDVGALRGPVVSPVFKETLSDGRLKTAPVYAKMARGAMVRWIFTRKVRRPADLLGFGEAGWEAASEPPNDGAWLFTRPARD